MDKNPNTATAHARDEEAQITVLCLSTSVTSPRGSKHRIEGEGGWEGGSYEQSLSFKSKMENPL